MLRLPLSFFTWFAAFIRSRHDPGLERVALRQQVGVLKRMNPRPRLSAWDRLFWVTFRRLWSRWADVLIVVKPETVVSWHRAGFRLYWRFLSRRGPGRRRITPELRQLIQRMAGENPTWGAPRIRGELLKLGFNVSERTVSRYLARLGRRGDAGRGWLIFLKNHRRELLDHVIVLNEAHLRRLVREYVRYYHEDRIHDALNKDTPDRRPVERREAARSRVVAMSRVGGLHHRYTWHSAA